MSLSMPCSLTALTKQLTEAKAPKGTPTRLHIINGFVMPSMCDVRCKPLISVHAPCSLTAMKKQLAEAKARKAEAAEAAELAAASRADSVGPSMHIETERFLTEEDFERIKYVAICVYVLLVYAAWY